MTISYTVRSLVYQVVEIGLAVFTLFGERVTIVAGAGGGDCSGEDGEGGGAREDKDVADGGCGGAAWLAFSPDGFGILTSDSMEELGPISA